MLPAPHLLLPLLSCSTLRQKEGKDSSSASILKTYIMSLGIRSLAATDDGSTPSRGLAALREEGGEHGNSSGRKRRHAADEYDDDDGGEGEGEQEEEEEEEGGDGEEEEDASGALHMLANSGARSKGGRPSGRNTLTPSSYAAAAAAASPFGFNSTGLFNANAFADAATLQGMLMQQQHMLKMQEDMQEQQQHEGEDGGGRRGARQARAAAATGSPLAIQGLMLQAALQAAFSNPANLAMAAASMGHGASMMGLDGVGAAQMAALLGMQQQQQQQQQYDEMGATETQQQQQQQQQDHHAPSRFKQEARDHGLTSSEVAVEGGTSAQGGEEGEPAPILGEAGAAPAAADHPPEGTTGVSAADAVTTADPLDGGQEELETGGARQPRQPLPPQQPSTGVDGHPHSAFRPLVNTSAEDITAMFASPDGAGGGSAGMMADPHAALMSIMSPQLMLAAAAMRGAGTYGDAAAMHQMAAAMSPLAGANPYLLSLLMHQQQQMGEQAAAIAAVAAAGGGGGFGGGGFDWTSMLMGSGGPGGLGGFASPHPGGGGSSGRRTAQKGGGGGGSRGGRRGDGSEDDDAEDGDDDGGAGYGSGGVGAETHNKRPWTTEESEYLSK